MLGTRPDIAYAVSKRSRYARTRHPSIHRRQTPHRYLAATTSLSLSFLASAKCSLDIPTRIGLVRCSFRPATCSCGRVRGAWDLTDDGMVHKELSLRASDISISLHFSFPGDTKLLSSSEEATIRVCSAPISEQQGNTIGHLSRIVNNVQMHKCTATYRMRRNKNTGEVSWCSNRQTSVTLSSTECKYMALAAQEAIEARRCMRR